MSLTEWLLLAFQRQPFTQSWARPHVYLPLQSLSGVTSSQPTPPLAGTGHMAQPAAPPLPPCLAHSIGGI